MNGLEIGPLVVSNDQIIAIVALATVLLVSEIFAWRRPLEAGAIRRWTLVAALTWIVAARVGFVMRHLDLFAQQPLSAAAIWQGGFDRLSATIAVAWVMFLAMLRRPSIIKPIAVSVLLGTIAFQVAGFALPNETRGRIPNLTFADVSGSVMELPETDGKPMVLNLWATWCPPCRREMPMLMQAAANDKEVSFVFANQGEIEEVIQGYLRYSRLAFDGVVLDEESSLMAKFGVLGLPSTLFFAADGELRAVHTGEITRPALLTEIENLKR